MSFTRDIPIDKKEEDIIGSNNFAERLGDSILKYEKKESIVIALCGKWGEGKSSVINLTKRYLEEKAPKDKLTIIDFNPWNFSEEKTITGCFFNEIATKLEKFESSKKYKKIAKNLRYYASLISSAPNEKTVTWIISFLFAIPAIIIEKIVRYLITECISISILNITIISIVLTVIIVFLLRNKLIKIANFFNKRTNYHFKSISEIKGKLKEDLQKINRKFLIIIDDIDRLNQTEIKQIFKLIKINADFPNFAYLTAFDRKIVEENLKDEQKEASGKDYLSKIVQVNFDIPIATESDISKLISKDLYYKIYSNLPEQAQKYFLDDTNTGETINESSYERIFGDFYKFKSKDYNPEFNRCLCGYLYGFRKFFKNIRDVKRFFNSLEFNISRMINKDDKGTTEVIEVNPIDFIALEAIRVFTPDFYNYMRGKINLFTRTPYKEHSDELDKTDDNIKMRKKELEKALKEYTGKNGRYEESVKDLMIKLFPLISKILSDEYYSINYDKARELAAYTLSNQNFWEIEQRICAPSLYNLYFTYIYGSEKELSRCEIEAFFNGANSVEELDNLLRHYAKNGKIRELLTSVKPFIDFIREKNIENILKAFFNIYNYNDYTEDDINNFKLDSAILYLLMEERDKEKNLSLLKEFIPKIQRIYLQLHIISYVKFQDKYDYNIVPQENIQELIDIASKKINENKCRLIHHKKLISIMSMWKELCPNNPDIKDFSDDILNDDSKIIEFIKHFIPDRKTKDYHTNILVLVDIKKNKETISEFMNSADICERLKSIIQNNTALYKSNKELIDRFLQYYTDSHPPYMKQ